MLNEAKNGAEKKAVQKREYETFINLFEVLNIETGERQTVELPSKQEVLNQIISLYNKEKQSRVEREAKWKEYFQAYNLKPSLPEPSLEWQSRTIIPKYFYTVEQFASIIRRSLVQSGKFFSLFTLRDELKDVAVVLEKLASYYLNSYSFLSEFEKAVKIGAITGEIILECSWERKFSKVGGKIRVKSYPSFKALSPFDVVIDSSALKRWMIKRYFIPIEEAFILQEMKEFEKFPLTNVPTTTENLDDTLQKSYKDYEVKEGYVEILEFIGNLSFNNNNRIYENLRILIANRQHIAKVEIFDNWDRELPIVSTHLYQPVKGVYGYSLFDVAYDMIRSLNVFIRLIEDWVVLSLGHIIEFDKTKLDEETASKIEKGFEPFIIVSKNSPDKLFQVSTLSQFNPSVMPIIQLFQQEIQNATALTEFILGLPTSKGRPTAREVMIKTQQSGAVLDSIAIRIENEIIEKIIHKLLILIIQNETIEKLQEILGEDFKVIESYFVSEEEKEKLAMILKDEIGIRVDGITQTLHRREQIENLLEFLAVVSQIPSASVQLNYTYYLERLSYLFGFTSRETLRQPSEEEIREQEENKRGLDIIAYLVLSNPELAKPLSSLIERIPPASVLRAFLLQQQQASHQTQQQKQEQKEKEQG